MNKFNLLLSSSRQRKQKQHSMLQKNAESLCCIFICLLCLHIETWCLNERLNEWIINKSFICLLILQKYIVWKLKIKIHDKLFYFLFQISTEILLKVIGKHFCIYLLIHCFQFLKLYTTQVDIACLLALHLRVFGFFWNVVINNWVH